MGQRAPAHCVRAAPRWRCCRSSVRTPLPSPRRARRRPDPHPRAARRAPRAHARVRHQPRRLPARCRGRRYRRDDAHGRAVASINVCVPPSAGGTRRRPPVRSLCGPLARSRKARRRGGRGGAQRVSCRPGFAKVDLERTRARGSGSGAGGGKTPAEIEADVRELCEGGASSVLVTRADAAARTAVPRGSGRAGARARPLRLIPVALWRLRPGRDHPPAGTRMLPRRTRPASAPSCAARTSRCTRTAGWPGSTASSRSLPPCARPTA
jgi:hypothetical protein